jgi:hypothetical protein
MATPAVTPQPTAWDEQGNPVQAQQPAASGATAWDEQGNPIAQQAAQPQGDYLSKTEEFIHGAAGGAAEEAWNQAKGVLSSIPGVGGIAAIPSEFKAYEQSRQQGKGMIESAQAASQAIKQKQDALSQLEDRFEEFKTNPSHATGKAIVDLLPLAIGMGMKGGSAIESTAEAAGEPGIVNQVMKGKDVAQPAAKSALKEAAGTDTSSLRESLSDPITEAETNAKELYKQIDDATGSDIKQLGEKLKVANRALRKSVSDAEDEALTTRRDQITERIAAAKQQAISRGVSPKVLDQADAEFKRMSALTDVEKRVFKNPDVVQGNDAHGTPESIDIDKAVKALQKLQDNEKYGGPRLEQAFGEDGAKTLLDKFYGAQRQGVHAMKMQKVARWIAAVAGAAGIAKGVSTLAGAAKND